MGDRIGILVTGPNASGKTTATLAALAPWAEDTRLKTVYADNSDRSAFKGDMAAMVDRMAAIWFSETPVVLVEGTNRIALVLSRAIARDPSARVVSMAITRTTAAGMRAMLMSRCREKGKRFRDDYWQEKQLDYEAARRYPNLRHHSFAVVPPERVRYFDMEATYQMSHALTTHVHGLVNDALGAAVPREKSQDVFQLRG